MGTEAKWHAVAGFPSPGYSNETSRKSSFIEIPVYSPDFWDPCELIEDYPTAAT